MKYRALPNLIGKRVVVTGVTSAPDEIHGQLRASLPAAIKFKGPDPQEIMISLAKYGILDVAFVVGDVLWDSGDSPGVPLLEEFGFVVRNEKNSTEGKLFDDDGQICLDLLLEDIDERSTLLKLFLEEEPKQDFKERFIRMASAGVFDAISGGGDIGGLARILEGDFPKAFVVSDACLTNADSIWFNIHFYM